MFARFNEDGFTRASGRGMSNSYGLSRFFCTIIMPAMGAEQAVVEL